MRKSLLKFATFFALSTSFVAHAGVVIESTRYLYKEGTREISAQLNNKDKTPYLMKSWVEAPEGSTETYFMVTPPLLRLEATQRNTVRIFPNANIAKAPKDRDSVYFFNVLAIPPTEANNTDAQDNKIQLAVRHRMRLIYRPKAIQNLSPVTESKKLEWRKANGKIIIKNPTPFFIYFKSVKIGGNELLRQVPNVDAFSTKEISLPSTNNGNTITWTIVNEHGGAGPEYSSSL